MLLNMMLPVVEVKPTARLPEEYQEVEYIQSSGKQHINSRFVPNQNTSVVCDVDFAAVSSTAFLFGSRSSGSTYWYNFLCTAAGFRSDFYTDTTAFAHAGGRMLIDKNKNVTTVNEIVVLSSTSGSFSTAYPLYLFAENNAGSAYGPCAAKIYYFQIYNGDTLERDFVPCYRKSDSVVGLYDLVNGVFYTNAGTGTFTKGADVFY